MSRKSPQLPKAADRAHIQVNASATVTSPLSGGVSSAGGLPRKRAQKNLTSLRSSVEYISRRFIRRLLYPCPDEEVYVNASLIKNLALRQKWPVGEPPVTPNLERRLARLEAKMGAGNRFDNSLKCLLRWAIRFAVDKEVVLRALRGREMEILPCVWEDQLTWGVFQFLYELRHLAPQSEEAGRAPTKLPGRVGLQARGPVAQKRGDKGSREGLIARR
jgi:hypothetical protein